MISCVKIFRESQRAHRTWTLEPIELLTEAKHFRWKAKEEVSQGHIGNGLVSPVGGALEDEERDMGVQNTWDQAY